MKWKLQASITIKKLFFLIYDFRGRHCCLSSTSSPLCCKSFWTFQMLCLIGGRDWYHQVVYHGILNQFLKTFTSSERKWHTKRVYEEDYSALLYPITQKSFHSVLFLFTVRKYFSTYKNNWRNCWGFFPQNSMLDRHREL